MTKITEMPLAGTLTGTELIEIVQNGDNKRLPSNKLGELIAPGYSDLVNQVNVLSALESTQKILRYDFEQTLTVRIVHGLGTKNFIETILGSDGERIYAPVEAVSVDEILITFTSPEAGTVSIIFFLS
jgi:hypothetical protein